MADSNQTSGPTASEVGSRLRDAAAMLGDSTALTEDVKQTLTDLLSELTRALDQSPTPPPEVARLAAGVAHLAESLQRESDPKALQTGRGRLEELLLQAESRAPAAVGLARQLIDALAGLGI